MIDKAIMRLEKIRQMFGLLAGFAFLQAIFIIGQAWMLSAAITHLWEGHTLKEVGLYVLGFFLFFMARHVITYLRERLLDNYAQEQAKKLRTQLLQKIFKLGPTVVQAHGTGNVTTMTVDGISQVENYIHLILAKMMNMMIVPWVILVVVFYYDWVSGVILLLVFPLIIIFMIVLGYAAQAKADRQYRSFQILSNHFIDSLRGIDTLKLFGMSKSYEKGIYQTSEQFRKATMSTLRIAILSTFALDFFTTLSVAIVAVFLGLRLLNAEILLFPALTVLILAPEYFLPVRDFSSDYHATLDGKNAMTAIREILELPENEVEQIAIAPWNESSTLDLSELSFDYGQGSGLQPVNLQVIGYQKIGVIGMSGSGKSTLMNVMSGFLTPKQGSILFNGEETTSFKQEDWQKQLIYIPQNPYVFRASLRENIAFYTPEADDAAIMQAIEVAGLSELLAQLPDGLDTLIGEGARSLSGGQAQRIALARAFLDKNRKVLILDEPTAHLDIETEVELKNQMLPLMENRLVFFATHRMHWMHQMDYILVLEEGKLVEAGTFNELTEKRGAFFELTKKMRGERHV
ncbi:thiol reductant ABC exporter subunit CydD [Enterococcus cecorum]|uniref:thiol reductant ABC exporter subunit CydD n=1 Tax=Enterococcus cecorum TaxID=44008 RepID=UPI0006415ECF|nr:thiol reductant ABC exporter subunit CydD [Enterococcus cecorum]KLN94336.1 cysteine ABC transporter ATP-binding protein [Enterococcus cecorum]KLN94450.1 cysteine ABC transporter ATP-binding protein [Enterococcus cecorum]KLO67191.1 cysteine ABC transporter ATP-binding protein [Enterococcus cecorum]KLO68518.1 cysteine ABC transporter ATP-binding protein [Enterococcus cecorum]MCJ0535251.1 thiol reductant ABC exporter subunit CydD [Enterococcus cecorum]